MDYSSVDRDLSPLICVPGRAGSKAPFVGRPGRASSARRATAHLAATSRQSFRFGALNMYVGSSEAAAARAFTVLDSLGSGSVDGGPERGVVVILDEIEKTVNRGDNDGGVSMRVTAQLLTWMSESTAPNMILATANDLQHMGDLAHPSAVRLDRISSSSPKPEALAHFSSDARRGLRCTVASRPRPRSGSFSAPTSKAVRDAPPGALQGAPLGMKHGFAKSSAAASVSRH